MSWEPRRSKVSDVVGIRLIGSVVEAHAPNEIHLNRFLLRCECGAEFHAFTQQIHNKRRHRGRLVCAGCEAPKVELAAKVTRLPVKRCEHGFLGGVDCQECHPELTCCPICGTAGHESKLCPATAAGRRRIAHLRNQRKHQQSKARRLSRIGAP